LLQPWTGPYGGLPPFDKVKVADFPAAFRAAIAEYRAEIARIANNPQPATFANTVAALENSGRGLMRASNLFGVWTSTLNTKAVQELERTWGPKLAAFADEITQNKKLFQRIEAVYKARAALNPEQQRLAWLYFTNFVRAGARLSDADKKQMSAYNQRLAELYPLFSQNQLFDEENGRLVLEKEDDLKGLPPSLVEAAAAAAREAGMPGKWIIVNTRSSMEPFMTYADRRDLRQQAFEMFTSRGDHPGAHDNNPVVTEILQLRAKRARLLGFPTYAHWKLENTMAGTPDKAMELMLKVWPAAVARVKEEVADMKAIAGHDIEPWDYRYYAEKVRKAKYDLDTDEIKAYLQLEKLREALFWASNQLYGFEYKPLRGVPVAHPDIRVYEVSRQGKPVGLWYFDPYARAGKRSGAWMSEYRTQENFTKNVLPIVSNNSNFVKGKAGAPVLISWDDAETMFHEFGHALHGLNSAVHYPSLAGTNTARDYVEFPSQVNEHWLATPEVLQKFALHHQTGQPMPAELLAKIERADTFNQGFQTVELLASALVDMKLHLAATPDTPIDPREFERKTLAELGMPKEIVMRHRLPQFGHLFSDDGYAAGYYSYVWSAVLDEDAYQAFLEAGGPYDKMVAKRLHDTIMSVGNSVDPAQAYRNFRGRDAKIDAFLKAKGFPTTP